LYEDIAFNNQYELASLIYLGIDDVHRCLNTNRLKSLGKDARFWEKLKKELVPI
jgi:hypothetical protein